MYVWPSIQPTNSRLTRGGCQKTHDLIALHLFCKPSEPWGCEIWHVNIRRIIGESGLTPHNYRSIHKYRLAEMPYLIWSSVNPHLFGKNWRLYIRADASAFFQMVMPFSSCLGWSPQLDPVQPVSQSSRMRHLHKHQERCPSTYYVLPRLLL